MSASTALRIGSGLLSFTLVARVLGPALFGEFMVWFSVATLLGLLANYGLTPYMLRTLALSPADTSRLMGEIITAKLLLSLVILVCSFTMVICLDTATSLVFMILLLAMLFDSMTEFLNTAYRTNNRYAVETKMATVASLLQLLTTVLFVLASPTVLSAALSVLVSRVCMTWLTWRNQLEYLVQIQLGSLRQAFLQLKLASSYAIDFILQSLLGQIDSIVIHHMVGVSAVGIYQAGMRVFQGCAQSANILANVFIPKIAVSTQSHVQGTEDVRSTQLAFIGVGLILAFIMAIAAMPITQILFGQQYAALAELMPWFGMLFFIRMLAASQGVILTSTGQQSFRTKANVALWLVVSISAYVLVPSLGLKGWLIALMLGNIVLASIYMIKVSRQYMPGLSTMMLAVAGCLVLVPFLIS